MFLDNVHRAMNYSVYMVLSIVGLPEHLIETVTLRDIPDKFRIIINKGNNLCDCLFR